MTLMGRVLEASRAGFYESCARAPSARELEDERLAALIREASDESAQTDGTPRLEAALARRGHQVSRARIGRLVGQTGLVAKASRRRRRARGSQRESEEGERESHVMMDFSVERPDAIWLADMGEVETSEGKLSIASLLDLGSRRILGWSVREDASVEGPQAALRMARARRAGRSYRGCIHHSDRGSVYTSRAYRRALEAAELVASFSGVGKCFENAPKESWFGTLKVEREWTGGAGAGRAQVRGEIIEYIEGFYNRRRLPSSSGYLSPLEFERRSDLEGGEEGSL